MRAAVLILLVGLGACAASDPPPPVPPAPVSIDDPNHPDYFKGGVSVPDLTCVTVGNRTDCYR